MVNRLARQKKQKCKIQIGKKFAGMKYYISIALVLVLVSAGCKGTKSVIGIPGTYNFSFSNNSQNKAFVAVDAGAVYNNATGFGFEKALSNDAVIVNGRGFITSNKPFFFSVRLPEGNYNVKVTLGDNAGSSDVVIRAECRRMMINRIQTKKGELKTVEFTVNIRDSLIRATNSKVRIKPREINYLHWDDKLTLEFNGNEPKVQFIQIIPASGNVVTIFLAGNSTVVDQAQEPYAAWGQMIPAAFEAGKVAVANYAESGESLSSFIAAKRFEKMLSLMKPGDYAFVEFGHNDQKQKGEGIGAFTSYTTQLKYFISEVKKKGGKPVLVTSMQRRSFDSSGKIIETLGDYPEANRRVATEENVALIDLNAMSKIMYEAWGPVESIKAFVHFPANTFPGQDKELKDNTHFTPFGAYEISRIIIEGIRNNNLGLAKFIKPGMPTFDPARPGKFDSFYWPYSPSVAIAKPDGN
jgi:lysophospholipase L1-like esterase